MPRRTRGRSKLRAIALAERLSALVYPSINAFYFTSGGAEATDTSIKTARFYWKAMGRPDKVTVVSRRRAYHGLTLAAMSATGLAAFWPMFEPRVPGFVHIDAPDPYRFVATTITRSASAWPRPISSRRRSSAKAPTPSRRSSPSRSRARAASSSRRADYFPRIREICDRYDVLFISDEVITGFGRTGRWFGLEHYGVEPDIMQFAKGITSGYVPLGGIGVSDRIRDAINGVPPAQRWMHAYTYSGHPTCCAVALRNIQILEDERLVERAATLGASFSRKLERAQARSRASAMCGRKDSSAPSRSSPTGPPNGSIRLRRR